jgi:Sulfotransferase domain
VEQTVTLPRLPNFLIIGAMRSGTTSLARYLDSHPDVFLAEHKELHFFDHHYERGIEWYRSRFADAGSFSYLGEATPNYMYDHRALERIATDIPEVKLIAVLRNPVDRAYSHYWHNRSRGKENLDFRSAIDAETIRLAVSEEQATIYSYIDRGRYATQLERVLKYFEPASLKICIFDDLSSDPREVVGDLGAFIGLNDTSIVQTVGAQINRYVEFRSLAVRRIAKRFPRPLRRIADKLNVQAARSYPPMPTDVRQHLIDYFADEVQRTSSIVGRDLSAFWSS